MLRRTGLWALDTTADSAENPLMVTRLDVFADITCPFTHVGLRRVVEELRMIDAEVEVDVVVRAWPLEWVNGAPLEADAVEAKIAALREQLGTTDFAGFRASSWPTTTIPALNLAAAAFAVDSSTGLAVSLAIRDALFEEGSDVGDPDVLATIADRFGLDRPGIDVDPRVTADYEEGQRRGVRGSPDFWVGDEEFFCPALTLGHDDAGLTAAFDVEGLERFMTQVRTSVSGG
jgi:predicted DsbA family dithiol-disulfide isomerase